VRAPLRLLYGLAVVWDGAAVEDYRELNRALWDERAPAHALSPDYRLDRFVDDPGFISDVVRFDLPLLGEVEGLRGVHLQCHIGTDTVSLGRLGACSDRAGGCSCGRVTRCCGRWPTRVRTICW
jgi:hypothetical protein